MRSTIRYQRPLLLYRSYKPNRVLCIKPATKLNFVFRPARFGVKPQIKMYEREAD